MVITEEIKIEIYLNYYNILLNKLYSYKGTRLISLHTVLCNYKKTLL